MSRNSGRIIQQTHGTKIGKPAFDDSPEEIPSFRFVIFEITSSVLNHSFECEVQVERYKKANLDGIKQQ